MTLKLRGEGFNRFGFFATLISGSFQGFSNLGKHEGIWPSIDEWHKWVGISCAWSISLIELLKHCYTLHNMFEQKNIHLHRNTLQSFVNSPTLVSTHGVYCWGTGLQPSILSSPPRMVTTLTTCGSFAIGATSPLPLVQSFCIFAAVVVLAPRPWSW